MPNVLDKELQDLLDETGDPSGNEPAGPAPASQVLFLPSNVTAAAGGRAAAPRQRPPSRTQSAPNLTQEEMEAFEEERQRFIENDPVVKNANGRDPMVLFNALKTEAARESANLAYQRSMNERAGKDGSAISSRRIDALKKIADIELEIRKIGVDQIDVYSEKFQKIAKLWIEMIQSAALETLGAEQANLFFNKLTSTMDGWEEKAEELVR